MHKIRTLFLSRNITRLARWHGLPRLRASLHRSAIKLDFSISHDRNSVLILCIIVVAVFLARVVLVCKGSSTPCMRTDFFFYELDIHRAHCWQDIIHNSAGFDVYTLLSNVAAVPLSSALHIAQHLGVFQHLKMVLWALWHWEVVTDKWQMVGGTEVTNLELPRQR